MFEILKKSRIRTYQPQHYNILTLSEADNNFSVEIIEISQKHVIINQSKPLP